MVDLEMSIFEFLTNFLIFWHHWHPWVCVRSVCWESVWKWNLKLIEAIPPSVPEPSKSLTSSNFDLQMDHILNKIILGQFLRSKPPFLVMNTNCPGSNPNKLWTKYWAEASSYMVFGSSKKLCTYLINLRFGYNPKNPRKFSKICKKIHIKFMYLQGFWSKSAYLYSFWSQLKHVYLQGPRT